MSTATLTGASLTSVQQQFEAALPSMDNVIRHYFRNWPARRRADALADARAALWAAWHSLVRRGKDPLQVGITGIAARCCLYASSGRKLGNANRGRACLDIFDRRARRRLGIEIISIEEPTGIESASGSEGWRGWLAGNNRVTPADEAAFRVDFARWLADLPERKRMMAELLLQGHETGVVASHLGVTPGAVSQARGWLESSWRAYQGEAGPPGIAKGHRPVGRPREAAQGASSRSGQ